MYYLIIQKKSRSSNPYSTKFLSTDRPRLRILHDGDRPPQVHDRGPQVRHTPDRHACGLAIRSHVAELHRLRLDVRQDCQEKLANCH